MFALCNKLTSATSLMATTLAEYCYRTMFMRCYKLTQMPQMIIDDNIIEYGCYDWMFEQCNNITNLISLHQDNSDYSDLYEYNMYQDLIVPDIDIDIEDDILPLPEL